MNTMYIAANNCVERGMFLGDTILGVKTAWTFTETEPHNVYVLSLQPNDKWNFLWDRFIREHKAIVVRDTWRNGEQHEQYRNFDERRKAREVHGIKFDTYKEIYPRLDGGGRQGYLCNGHEVGLGRANILQYFYFGQERCVEPPPESTLRVGPGVIDIPQVEKSDYVIVAPHEKCQGNRIFSLGFWEQVIVRLLARHIRVIINSGTFHVRGAENSFAGPQDLIAQVAAARAVACGNTGIGWVAAVCGTPLIACERDMCFGEYSFKACGCESLKTLVTAPDPDDVARGIFSSLER